MKTKIILLIIGAVVTLSFSFSSGTSVKNSEKQQQSVNQHVEPIGGFVAEEVAR